MLSVHFAARAVFSKSIRFTVPAARQYSNLSHETATKANQLADNYNKHVQEMTTKWAKNDEIYKGKDRDNVNFPTIKYQEMHPKVRLGFLPDSWFQILYPKTGVTGPYLLLFGSLAFMLSKEIWVVDPHFVEVVFSVGMATALIKKFGPKVREYFDQDIKENEDRTYYKPLKNLETNLDRTTQTADEEIARTTAIQPLIDSKVENLDLQLESVYRERLQHVHRAVQRRLNYHVERENTRRRYLQQHTINWVLDRVVKGITPAQEKENMAQCISELKRLSQTQLAT